MRISAAILITLITVGAGCAANVPAPSGSDATQPTGIVTPDLAPGERTLDLSGTGLTSVPMDTFSRTDLDVLDVSNNKLTGALPSQIGNLTNLKTLDASDNQMTGVPAEVRMLRDLQVLDLSNNRITGLPMELGDLTQLKVLDLRGNPYSTQDLDAIAAKLTNTEIRR